MIELSIAFLGSLLLNWILLKTPFVPFREKSLVGGMAIFIMWMLLGEVDFLTKCAMLIFVIGIVDDYCILRWYEKLGCQIGISLIFVLQGFQLQWGGYDWWLLVEILWIVGIVNAFNLSDNMDGLAGGLGIIMGIYLGEWILVSCLLGFMVFNFKPAKVYMGDSGSMFLGFILAGKVWEAGGGHEVDSLIFCILIMLVPIMDTIYVTVKRTFEGKAFYHGGKDHVSHVLVREGLSEREAVMVLWGIGIVGGGLAMLLKGGIL